MTMTVMAVKLPSRGLCSRCGGDVSVHPNGQCPDGGGSYSWTMSRSQAKRTIRRLEGWLEEFRRMDAWKKKWVRALSLSDAISWCRHHKTTRPYGEIARAAWGYHARTPDGEAWCALMADVSMAFCNFEALLYWLTSAEPCGDRVDELDDWHAAPGAEPCTCPSYPCPCGYDPIDNARFSQQQAEHYAGSAVARASRMLPLAKLMELRLSAQKGAPDRVDK